MRARGSIPTCRLYTVMSLYLPFKFLSGVDIKCPIEEISHTLWDLERSRPWGSFNRTNHIHNRTWDKGIGWSRTAVRQWAGASSCTYQTCQNQSFSGPSKQARMQGLRGLPKTQSEKKIEKRRKKSGELTKMIIIPFTNGSNVMSFQGVTPSSSILKVGYKLICTEIRTTALAWAMTDHYNILQVCC